MRYVSSTAALLLALACSENGDVGGHTAGVSGGNEKPSKGSPVVSDPLNAAAAPVVSDEQYQAAVVPGMADPENPSATVEVPDSTGAAWRIIEVPALALPTIVSTPKGWFAASRRSLGQGKTIGANESALYRSKDGVHWKLVPVDGGTNLAVRDMAYGNGTYVMVGSSDDGGVFLTSHDGEHFEEIAQPELDQSQRLSVVDFAGGLFFAFGFRVLAVSEDGKNWTLMGSDILQFGRAAFGNGRYVLAGNGPMMVSENGYSWVSHDVDCNIPDACITDPSGNVSQSYQSHLLFIDGYFYSDQMRSNDGATWEALPNKQPTAYVGNHFLGGYPFHLDTWTPKGKVQSLQVVRPAKAAVTAEGRDPSNVGRIDSDTAIPDTVNVPFDDGLDCKTASCVIVDGYLVLVPPLGTEPLPDRVPRDDEGAPLLSDECPVSQMLTCDDYAERSGCVCDPYAPENPDYCQDVGDFECAGAFDRADGEWNVPDLGAAGCDCNAVDPNEPPTFGDDCRDDATVCAAPLECLEVDAPASYGDPTPPPYVCTAACESDDDCPSWTATGYCKGAVHLTCSNGSCQPRECE
jgi:hypothetical protein